MGIIRKIILVFIFCFTCNNSFGEEALTWACGDYPYAYYLNEKGETTGFLYDIAIEALQKRMGIKVNLDFLSWQRCQVLVKAGDYDMMLTIPTAERLNYSGTTKTPVWKKIRYVYTYKNHPKMIDINSINGLEDIKRLKLSVISYIGNGWIKESVEGIGIKVNYSPVIENMYQMLINRRGDLILEERSLVDAALKKDPVLAKNIIKTEGIGSSSGFHIMISKKSKYIDILEELDKVIQEMWDDGTIEDILSRYGV